jgi:hypothetical protein
VAISNHLTKFGGLPVREFNPALEDLSGVAWRFAAEEEPLAPLLDDALDTLGERAAQLEGVILGAWSEEMFEESPEDVVNVLLEYAGALSGLRALFVGDVTYEECEISWLSLCPLGHLPAALPGLKWLGIRGSEGLELEDLGSPTLEGLVLQAGGLPPALLCAVDRADLPALTHLELWIGTPDYNGGGRPQHLEGLLSGEAFPALRSLGLRNAQNADELAAAVAASPLFPRLEALDLSMGTLGDEGAAALLDHPHLDKLRRLNIAHHFLSEATLARLGERLGDRLLGAGRRGRSNDDRYVEVSE